MNAEVIDLCHKIFVNDQMYEPDEWEKAFEEFYSIIDNATHCTQRLRIGMVNIDYHAQSSIFTVHGYAKCGAQTIARSLLPVAKTASNMVDSIISGFIIFATDRAKKVWRIHLKNSDIIFRRNEQNELQVIISGKIHKTTPLPHEDCS